MRFGAVFVLVGALVLAACSEDSTTAPGADPDPVPADTLRPPDPGLSFELGCLVDLPVENCFGGGGVLPDEIKSLNEPSFISADQVDFLSSDDRVFGIEIEGRFFAFPRKILNLHEIVNFTVTGEDGAIVQKSSATWCPLTFSFIEWRHQWDRPASGRASFGVSGGLLDNNLILFDRETNTIWPQILGVATAGPKEGQCLEMGRNAVDTSWSFWRRLHPDTVVLSNRPKENPDNPEVYETNFYGEYWAGRSAAPNKVTFPDKRFPAQKIVLAVHGEEGTGVAILGARRVGEAKIGGTDMVFFHDPGTNTTFVYENDLKEFPVPFSAIDPGPDGVPRFRDADTESIWRIDGVAIDGPLKGERLAQVPSFHVYWFSIATLFRDVPIFNL